MGTSGEFFVPESWSPDGSMLAGVDRAALLRGKWKQDLVIYRPSTHRYERLPGVGYPVGWLPDSKRFLVKSDRLYILDLATRSRTLIGSWPAGASRAVELVADRGQTVHYTTSTTDAAIWLMNLGKRQAPRVRS